ncbi:MOSC domain-containing protein [Flexivirga meconopsidis]|uniref:MOSC domain-containing protein n=1 Tax=Flexivirga meconopsidis TaxID=2977121 RepID=UPI00223E9B21|nr:MOSC N-terminal beta barrel domain-containing protein [Flexivirga meconopsidis]
MKIVSLRVHPVKSTAIREVSSSYLSRAGLHGDREWMVVDADGATVSARELPALFTIAADAPGPAPEDPLVLRAPGVEPLSVARPAGPHVSVRMFTRPPMDVIPAGGDADAWLQRALSVPGLRLVWCDDPMRRSLNPAFSRAGDHARLQDGYPLTVCSLASLRQLNEWIAQAGGDALPVDRFRPNVVIDGGEPFAEDHWQSVQLGSVTLRAAKSVDRCVMTLIDPVTLAKGKEPIRTLSRHRRWDGKTWFCHHLIPDGEGEIAVGDQVFAS